MYGPLHILKGLTNPRGALLEVLRLINTHRAVQVSEQDWDNLIILDACRYDVFQESDHPEGELTSVRSLGSKTGEFLKANFAEPHSDTVYVSANPQIQLHDIERYFYETIRLWESHWDENHRTVPPDTVAEQALATQCQYPNKRLIVHFVQPHYPFLGETGKDIDHGTMIGDGLIAEERSYPTVWERLERGDLSRETAWQAYEENLELTLPHVRTLLDGLIGRSVVTSDHGNAFGEWALYGHPAQRHIRSLVRVPWLVVDSKGRKNIKFGTLSNFEEDDDSNVVEDRLRDLGYRT